PRHPLDLHSFPTRRSSDLSMRHCLARRTSSAGMSLKESPAANCASCLAAVFGTGGFWRFNDETLANERRTQRRSYSSNISTTVRSEEHTSELQSLAYLVCR